MGLIRRAEEGVYSVLLPPRTATLPSYHLQVDKHCRWNVGCSVTRPEGNEREVSLTFFMADMHGAHVILNFNDAYLDRSGPWCGFKFDSEDIYIAALYRQEAGMKLWHNCELSGLYLDSGTNTQFVDLAFRAQDGVCIMAHIEAEEKDATVAG